MAVNKHRKEKKTITGNMGAAIQSNRIWVVIIFIFTFFLYGNTIPNQYALDDAVVINGNRFTQKGFSGIKDILRYDTFTGYYGKDLTLQGGRYRPLSLIIFAMEHQLWGDNPHISHLINVLLYGITGVLVFLILSNIFPNYNSGNKKYLSFPFLAGIFFIAHPIHTEVVANIKGLDEILSLLFSLLTLWLSLKFTDTKKIKYLFFSFSAFFPALLSKENAVTFMVVIPLTIYFFRKQPFRSSIMVFVPLLVSTAVFLILRGVMAGNNLSEGNADLMNNPFVHTTPDEKYATIIYTLGIYIRLLFFPHPLTYDYYPYHIPIVHWFDIKVLLSLTVYILLIIIAAIGIKRKTIYSYGILYYIVTLSIVSNLFITVGTFMAERFAYMPSLGFCIISAFMLTESVKKSVHDNKRSAVISALLIFIVLSLYAYKTVSRNTAWKNDLTLCETDVITSSNSAKSNKDLGNILFALKLHDKSKREEYLKRAITYLRKAIEIYPDYIEALDIMGSAHYLLYHNFDSTLYYNKRILIINPTHSGAYDNIQTLMDMTGDTTRKIQAYEDIYKMNPSRFEVNYALGMLYKGTGNLQKAAFYLNNAFALNPQSMEVKQQLKFLQK